MLFRFSPVACAAVAAIAPLALICTAQAQVQEVQHAGVLVSATRVDMQDTDAPYASEVHTRADIERSGAHSLYDYIAQQTSLQITPSIGNRYHPKISMRGYGADGYQNLTISVDGRRINSMDMVPQQMGAISLADIDRIEITKGSGAVLFGDHATSGTIQIYTKARNHAHLDSYTGSHGQQGAVLSAGLVRDKLELSASADHSKEHGLGQQDPTGHTNQSEANIWRVTAAAKPLQDLRLHFEAGAANIDTRFPDVLTQAEFAHTPSTTHKIYSRNKIASHYWGVGFDYQLSQQLQLSWKHHDEDRLTDADFNGQYPWQTSYRSRAHDLNLQIKHDQVIVNTGIQLIHNVRGGETDRTTKKNQAAFVQGQYALNASTLSAGFRREKVSYRYTPMAAQALDSNTYLNAWDLGLNHRLTPQLAAFANYANAFNSPDVDRFFDYGQFNRFIEPAKARTITLGLNHSAAHNRLKASLFYAKLKNEIYYYKTGSYTGINTNIDKSHKYGLELQDRYQVTRRVSALVNYTWTRAIMDRENEGGGAFNGKELPGVSRHSMVLGLNVRVAQNGNLALTHTWRSSAWAEEDLANANSQKQRAYQSTDVSYRHQVAKQVELYGSVSNLFARKNGIWVRDDAIFPVNFERTWKLGARINF